MPCYLAIDCGLTQIKAAVIDDTGRALSLSGATTPVRGTVIDVSALTQNLYTVVSQALKQANATVTQICAAGHGIAFHGKRPEYIDDNRQSPCLLSALNQLQNFNLHNSDLIPI